MSLSPEQLNEYREGLRQQLVRERQASANASGAGLRWHGTAECLKAR